MGSKSPTIAVPSLRTIAIPSSLWLFVGRMVPDMPRFSRKDGASEKSRTSAREASMDL